MKDHKIESGKKFHDTNLTKKPMKTKQAKTNKKLNVILKTKRDK